MIRTQILLDPETHQLLHRAAAARGVSLSALVREAVRGALGGPRKGVRRRRRYGFSFVGCIRGDRRPVAEEHDAALGEGGRW